MKMRFFFFFEIIRHSILYLFPCFFSFFFPSSWKILIVNSLINNVLRVYWTIEEAIQVKKVQNVNNDNYYLDIEFEWVNCQEKNYDNIVVQSFKTFPTKHIFSQLEDSARVTDPARAI